MEKKRIIILIYFLGVSSSALFAQTAYDQKLSSLYKNTVPQIKSTDLKSLLLSSNEIVLLDTRSEKEFKVSHLLNAYLMDYEDFNIEHANRIKRNTPIIVYCSVGYRSERIGEKLIEMGFKNVHNLYGGIFEWVNEGNDVVNSLNHVTDSVHTYNKNWSEWLVKGVKVY